MERAARGAAFPTLLALVQMAARVSWPVCLTELRRAVAVTAQHQTLTVALKSPTTAPAVSPLWRPVTVRTMTVTGRSTI